MATTATVLASTAIASKATTAIKVASTVATDSSSVVQAPTVVQSLGEGILHAEHARGHADVLPLEDDQLEFQGISDLFDQTGSSEAILPSDGESISTPDFNQPSITGLRKSKE